MIEPRARPAVVALDLDLSQRSARGAWRVLGPAVVGALALGSGALVLYATPFGPGTGWDQSMYVGAARSLAEGRGLSIPWGTDAGMPLTHFPPLFPTVLAGLAVLGIDPLSGAQSLNAALRGANLLLVALLVARVEPRSLVGPVLTAVLFFTSVHMASLHGQAWSEPLFLPLCFGALFALGAYVRTPGWAPLLASASLAAAAVLTRYVGLAVVLTALASIALTNRRAPRLKMRDGLVFGLVALAPLLLWGMRNALVGQPALGYRDLAWHPAGLHQLGQVVYVVFDWFMPNQVASRLVASDGSVSAIGAALLAVAALAASAVVVRVRRTDRHPFIGLVLPIFAVAYLASVLAASMFFDHRIQIDSRTLSPVYIALIVGIGVSVARLPKQISAAFIVMVALIMAVNAARLTATVQRAHAEGISYSSTRYLASAVMNGVRDLPSEAVVYSNAPDAIYLLTDRPALALPDAATLDETIGRIQGRSGPLFVAYFSDPDIAYRQLTPALLEPWFDMTVVAQDASGVLLRMAR